MSYNIETEFGWDIDPVYIKDLRIKLSKDSIVKSFRYDIYRK